MSLLSTGYSMLLPGERVNALSGPQVGPSIQSTYTRFTRGLMPHNTL